MLGRDNRVVDNRINNWIVRANVLECTSIYVYWWLVQAMIFQNQV
jgi:hypothetical protein